MQIKIEGTNFQGDGYGLFNGKKVFIPKTYKGDLVEFETIKENNDFIFGKLIKILEKSNERVDEIICPVYDECGGCNFLHLKDDVYYDFKKSIIENALKKSGYTLNNINFIKIEYNTRRRVSFQIKNNKLGFFEKNSNNIVEVNTCPLISNNINFIIPELKEISKKLSLTEILITNHENGLEIVFNLKKDLSFNESNNLKKFAESNKNIIIISYKINDGEPFLFMQKMAPTLTFSNEMEIELIPNIFLQATLEGQNAITKIVVENLKNSKNVLDLYCGIGTYTFPLAEYTKIHSVEGDKLMIDNLKNNIKLNNLNGKITTECRNLVSSPLLKNELDKYDGIVINPPRSGANAQCKQITKSKVKNIVMVSCNPQTFSIDANELKNGGFELISITGIDQFYRTQHLEIVGVFKRK